MDEYYQARVTIKSNLSIISQIETNLRLRPSRLKLFRQTCFGKWLKIKSTYGDPLLVHLILQKQIPSPTGEEALFFNIGGRIFRFGQQEFCLVTGMRFSRRSPALAETPDESFNFRVLGCTKGYSPRRSDLDRVFNIVNLNNLTDADAVRVCLLVLVTYGFLGLQPSNIVDKDLIRLVEDLDAWNKFPWGNYLWNNLYPQLKDALHKREGVHQAKRMLGTQELIKYTLHGFVFAFKIWILETFPHASRKYGLRTPETIPRACGWQRSKAPLWHDCLPYVNVEEINDENLMPLAELLPTPAESESGWWKESLRYFEYISKQQHGASTSKAPESSAPTCHLTECIRDCQNKMDLINDLFYNGQVSAEAAMQHAQTLQEQINNAVAMLQNQQYQTQDPETVPEYNDTIPNTSVSSPVDDDFTEKFEPQNLNFASPNIGGQNINFASPNSGGVDFNFAPPPPNFEGYDGRDYNYNNPNVGTSFFNPNNFNPQNLYAQYFQSQDLNDQNFQPQELDVHNFQNTHETTPMPQQRIRFPGPYQKSPYRPLPDTTPRDKDSRHIKDEMLKLYKKNKLNNLTIKPYTCQPWPKDLWSRLLKNRWFDTMHVDTWAYIKLVERDQTCKRTILPSCAFHFMHSPGTQFINHMDGTKEEYPTWYSVSEVLIPMNIDDCHWVLTVLNLTTWMLRIYDSMNCENSYLSILKYVEKLATQLPKYLNAMNFWERKGLQKPLNWTLNHVYIDHVPQQAHGSGDCGAFVCHFMEEIMTNGDITYAHGYPNYNPVDLNQLIRMYLASEFYKYRVG